MAHFYVEYPPAQILTGLN